MPEDRAREGVFLAFQYPVEIPGVNNAYLRGGGERHRKAPRLARTRCHGFPQLVKDKMKLCRWTRAS